MVFMVESSKVTKCVSVHNIAIKFSQILTQVLIITIAVLNIWNILAGARDLQYSYLYKL